MVVLWERKEKAEYLRDEKLMDQQWQLVVGDQGSHHKLVAVAVHVVVCLQVEPLQVLMLLKPLCAPDL